MDNILTQKCFCLPWNLLSRQALIIFTVVQLVLGSVSTTAIANTESRYMGTLSFGDPIFLRPNASKGVYYYEAIQVMALASGVYTFQVTSEMYTSGYLYSDSFNPNNFSQNLILTDEASAGYRQTLMNVYLQNNRQYFLIMTTKIEETSGSFAINTDGPDQLRLTTFVATTITSTLSTRTGYPEVWEYLGSLTQTDQKFARPGGMVNNFYYKTIRLSVFSNGYYTILGTGSVNIIGVLYNNDFFPSIPTQNLIVNNYNMNANKQFTINTWLQTTGIYILVVTTYASGDMTDFTITATGPARPSFDLITSNTVAYSTTLRVDDPMFIRPGNVAGRFYYKAIIVTVPWSGTYTFSSSSIIDTYCIMYRSPFIPSSPSQNIMSYDDDGNGDRQFKITITLQSSTEYVLVVTTYSNSVTGDVVIVGNGPSQPTFNLYATTTYNNSLTPSSSIFIRPNGNSGYYYYQAIEVTVLTSGTYIFTSASALDMYGCLYDDYFSPSYPNAYLTCNDDGAGSGQFSINWSLQSSRTYILVVTTYASSTFAAYTILATGPDRLVLSSTTRTTRFPIRTTTMCFGLSCGYSEGSKITMIVGITIACVALLAIVFSICVYQQKKSSVTVRHLAAQQASHTHTQPNTATVQRAHAPYTIPMSSMRNVYTEQLPPSYDAWMASAKPAYPQLPAQ